jgi:glycosyltransferase involved in cell wall biosynthesis
MGYVLITPVRNEEKYIPFHIQSVIDQTVLPDLWVIIDGNSSDNSVAIAENLCKDHDSIIIIQQQHFSNLGGHHNFSLAVREAYTVITEVSKNRNIDFGFVGKLDADSVISPDYFETLLKEFEKNPKLAVVSGTPYCVKPNTLPGNFSNLIRLDIVPDLYPSNSLPDKRLYRKEILLESGGFPLSKYSPDTVLLAKFRMKGYTIRMSPDTMVINLRTDMGIEKNAWKSAIQLGSARYYLGYHPLLIAMGSFYLLFYKGFISAFGMIMGYLISRVKKEDRINDDLVKQYFGEERIKEIAKTLCSVKPR